jgi:site-specific DNA-methyltransferase (adenine-specific)
VEEKGRAWNVRSGRLVGNRAGAYLAPMITVHRAENLEILPTFRSGSFGLIYIDPPFNTGRTVRRSRVSSRKAADGEVGTRTGFGGKRYVSTLTKSETYADRFDDYPAWLAPRLVEARRLLSVRGSLFVHLDYREVHYVKVLLDTIFGRESFVNEIIWAYDYGARSSTRWSPKHDTILWYAKTPGRHIFNADAADRIPYMAPGLVTPEKVARGKMPTDTWWHTIVSPTGKEKTGYPTQKPLGVLERIVKVHSRPKDRLLDFFAGSGSFGDAADRNGRDVTLVDSSAAAIRVMKRRFAGRDVRFY